MGTPARVLICGDWHWSWQSLSLITLVKFVKKRNDSRIRTKTTAPVAMQVQYAAKLKLNKHPQLEIFNKIMQSVMSYWRLNYISIMFTYLKLQAPRKCQ